jgi:hypothetical protein
MSETQHPCHHHLNRQLPTYSPSIVIWLIKKLRSFSFAFATAGTATPGNLLVLSASLNSQNPPAFNLVPLLFHESFADGACFFSIVDGSELFADLLLDDEPEPGAEKRDVDAMRERRSL